MNEFIKALIERLEEEKKREMDREENITEDGYWDDCEDAFEDGESNGMYTAYTKEIKIVNQLAEEYNNGWILVSVRLPEEPTEKLDEQHEIERAIRLRLVKEYIVTIEDAEEPTALYYIGDGFWYDEVAEDFCRVAAWRPFMPAWQQNQESTEKTPKADKRTRGDKIRSMSDEEIVEAIMSLGVDKFEQISFCKNGYRCNEILDAGELIPESLCKECLMEWLQSEAEE